MPHLQDTSPIVLTIAGSDSGGGAGIQADIKAISATGSYACSVVTAITSQNTQGVRAIHPIPIEHVASQLAAVFEDLNVVAVKVGMLADANIIQVVADHLAKYRPKFVVVDPVMVATSGDLLLEQQAIQSLKQQLLPLADLVTPNLPEAAALLDIPTPSSEDEMGALVAELRGLASNAVLLKGGHLTHQPTSNDLLVTADDYELVRAKRVLTNNTHGTGCTLSSAIASYVAQGHRLHKAVCLAKQYLTQALTHADDLQVGHGHGPVSHFFPGHYNVR
ncbi:bifunctional hydroxymethylpyrimidine kinase/phosphomethylpyrimidine kinase [Vibrio sinaloensis]|uniref:bifunctional hydroxymethylpyrimidine kinase/phosphomethylpyrimidine kinase n=1 Tax=Photobacterium sp. (strain ATCC 43367) TaxID=379097 RepID=UPI00204D0A06|nr:bifunctional hydroxymethylpyrimidine kinase/phosphomethylpyrimidine kinase [Vibrio sinaloensis]UPQ89411.1 bifunctional hydroxymethylpyrimidine kinase/phosphomethylpyrimidine kinase [Vibrio sinaloensis]